ncbi:2-hydroxyacid dehydrogenase [Natronosporangium hydrolyticum]|uniref:2-hydroxyacid dehydrogenase n=1 Tax=Natronosporangium hydrolyticum TaxID=2811111 RepID=A0A895YE03_9ACTN|nr:2-hydroxyacid dehydrogenase [Natronosporangium hydrolyticum]QSB15811.1 2-hydroxyacid dehydrogenase [Natronosporangium hydrolyticum]
MARKLLVAGDYFVTPGLVSAALADRVGEAVAVTELTLPWPHEPLRDVAEVSEASGDEERLVDALAGVEIAITQVAPFTSRVFAAAESLRLVVVCRGGPVNVNLAAAQQHGVQVRNTPGRNAVAAAEHTVALLLAALRRVPELHADLRAGHWDGSRYALTEVGEELAGNTVGLVGYGEIGRRVARVLRAFDAQVLVSDPYLDTATLEGAETVSLPELLARSRVVSLHARLTEQTRHLIGAAELAAMPRGAVLVNTARGGLLDYPAVVAALASGQLGAAALDVFDVEPLPPDAPILTAPRVVLTPHLAGGTRQTAQRAAALSAEVVAEYLRR